MNNQAAQTIPELPAPVFFAAPSEGYTAAQMHQHARDYAAALSQTAGVPEGWKLVPVEPTDTMLHCGSAAADGLGSPLARTKFAWKAMLIASPDAAAPSASGGEVKQVCDVCEGSGEGGNPDGDCALCGGRGEIGGHVGQTAETFDYVTEPCPECNAPQPPAGASASERARELLAAEYMASKFAHDNAYGLCIKDGSVSNSDIKFALRALEQALTQQRGGGECEPVADGEVLVVVTGMTGTGKSAVAGEIEILCRALGLEVEHDNAQERGMTHGDWTSALELYKPRVRIVEKNIPRKS